MSLQNKAPEIHLEARETEAAELHSESSYF